MTILISSHNLKEIEDLCDHIGNIHKGNLVIEKELDELKSDVHKVQVAYKQEMPAHLVDSLDVLHYERRGSVCLLIVKGKVEVIEEQIRGSIRFYLIYCH